MPILNWSLLAVTLIVEAPFPPGMLLHEKERSSLNSTPTATFVLPPTRVTTPVVPCVCDANGDHIVTIDELIRGVNAALHGCQ